MPSRFFSSPVGRRTSTDSAIAQVLPFNRLYFARITTSPIPDAVPDCDVTNGSPSTSPVNVEPAFADSAASTSTRLMGTAIPTSSRSVTP